MDDQVEINSEVQETATPQTENQEVSTQEAQVEEEVQRPIPQETDDRQERNWGRMREKQKDLERELRMQKELNERLLQMSAQLAPQQPQEKDELDEIGDEDYIPKGKVKKLVQREKDNIVKATVEEMEKRFQQKEDAQFMDRLKRQYSDFEDVVNTDTLALLEEQEPELATAIAASKDPYKIGVQTYKYIKALNISTKVPEARRAKEVEKKLEKNAKTVQSPQAYDKRPMAQAFKMTEVEKKQLYEEMIQFSRGAN